MQTITADEDEAAVGRATGRVLEQSASLQAEAEWNVPPPPENADAGSCFQNALDRLSRPSIAGARVPRRAMTAEPRRSSAEEASVASPGRVGHTAHRRQP